VLLRIPGGIAPCIRSGLLQKKMAMAVCQAARLPAANVVFRPSNSIWYVTGKYL
jgi:hypothetical protein